MNAPINKIGTIGGARSRCILEAKVLTDGGGGNAEAWEPYALVWGELRAQSGVELASGGRIESRTSHQLAIRRRTDVSATHRVRIGERVFAIVAVVDEGAQAFWLTLILEEGAPS